MDDSSQLRIYLNDGYWTKLLFAAYHYEPELDSILRRFMGIEDVVLFDCGANIGYWSIVASGRPSNGRTIVAVEASPPTFSRLLENAALNSNRFECRLKAVWSEPKRELQIVSHSELHAGATVLPDSRKTVEKGYKSHTVATTTIDQLCRDLALKAGPIVVKLDVEDAELEALRGATYALLELGAVVIYEEHGRHDSNRATEYLLENPDMSVYFCNSTGRLTEIKSESELARIKLSSSRGYNFLSCASDSSLMPILMSLVDSGATAPHTS